MPAQKNSSIPQAQLQYIHRHFCIVTPLTQASPKQLALLAKLARQYVRRYRIVL